MWYFYLLCICIYIHIYKIIQMTKLYFSCIFGLHPWCLTHSPEIHWKFLSVESDKNVFCYVNEVTFGKHLSLGAGYQWLWLESWNFQSHRDLREGKGPGGWIQWFNQVCRCDEASVKIQNKDFPGGPVTKTSCSQCRGPAFNHWSGN